MTNPQATLDELDVRPVPRPEKHPMIFGRYHELAVGESFVLVNDHDPRHLHDEFDVELGDAVGWEYLQQERGNWRIKISKLASTGLPRVLTSTAVTAPAPATGDSSVQVVWKLQARDRDLDSNLVSIAPGQGIDRHVGPDVDVLILVVGGSGQFGTERGEIAVQAGDVVWMPRKAIRQFTAGPAGLRYLTVHQHRQALVLHARPGGPEA